MNWKKHSNLSPFGKVWSDMLEVLVSYGPNGTCMDKWDKHRESRSQSLTHCSAQQAPSEMNSEKDGKTTAQWSFQIAWSQDCGNLPQLSIREFLPLTRGISVHVSAYFWVGFPSESIKMVISSRPNASRSSIIFVTDGSKSFPVGNSSFVVADSICSFWLRTNTQLHWTMGYIKTILSHLQVWVVEKEVLALIRK